MQRDIPENKATPSLEADAFDLDLSDFDADINFEDINPFACDDYTTTKPSILDNPDNEERTFRQVRKILNNQRINDPIMAMRGMQQGTSVERKHEKTNKDPKKEQKKESLTRSHEKESKSEKAFAEEETKKHQKEIKDKLRLIRKTIKNFYKAIKDNEQYEKNFPSKDMKGSIKANRQRYVDLLLFEMTGIHKNHPDYSELSAINYIILTKYMVDFINASTERRLDKFTSFTGIQLDFKHFIEIKQKLRRIQIKIKDFYESKDNINNQSLVDYLLFEMAGVDKKHQDYTELFIITPMMLIKYMNDFNTERNFDSFTRFTDIQLHFRNYILEKLANKFSEIVTEVAEIKSNVVTLQPVSEPTAATPPPIVPAEAQSRMLECLNSLLHSLHNTLIQLRLCLSHIKMPSCVFFRRIQEDLDDGLDHKHGDPSSRKSP